MCTPNLYGDPPRTIDEYYRRVNELTFTQEIYQPVYLSIQPQVPEDLQIVVWRYQQQEKVKTGNRFSRSISTEDVDDVRQPVMDEMVRRIYGLFSKTVTPPLQIRAQVESKPTTSRKALTGSRDAGTDTTTRTTDQLTG